MHDQHDQPHHHHHEAVPSLSSKASKLQLATFVLLLLLGITFRLVALFSEAYRSILDLSFHGKPVAQVVMGVTEFKTNMHDFYHSHAYSTLCIVGSGSLLMPLVRYWGTIWVFFSGQFTSKANRQWVVTFLDVIGKLMMAEFYGVMIDTVFFKIDLDMLGLRAAMRISFHLAFQLGSVSNLVATLLMHTIMYYTSPVICKFKAMRQTAGMHVCSIALVGAWVHLLGFQAPIAYFEMTGLVGKAFHRNWGFSLMDLFWDFPKSTLDGEPMSSYFNAWLYLVLIVIVPFIVSIIWLGMLYLPIGNQLQGRMCQILPGLMSWVGTEVFTLVAISQVYENGLVADFLFYDKAPQLCDAMDNKVKLPCAGVDGFFKPGMLSMFVLCCCMYFMRFAAHRHVEYLLDPEEEDCSSFCTPTDLEDCTLTDLEADTLLSPNSQILQMFDE
ncbi:hypothetical protein BASA81_006425 [Batrachochytrium salamandrivorans]|nr:hypothetical protein BASA81_006425 [Batrachochytrium salamandrivorans]